MKNNTVTIGEIFDHIDSFAPFETQFDWDNSGIIVGRREDSVSKILVCLDATLSAVEYAAENECDLIVSHHPLIFRPIKGVASGSALHGLIRCGCGLISAHTNLDKAERGVNYCLANAIKLRNIHMLKDVEMGFGGELEQPLSAKEFAQTVSKALGGCCRFSPVDRLIKKVAVIGGSASEFVAKAFEQGYDAFLTGEAKHHEFIAAREQGVCLMAAGHHETESVVLETMHKMLCEKFPNIAIELFDENPTVCVLS